MWCGKANANGGICAVAWSMVFEPTWSDDLGVPNLQWLKMALQERCPWLQQMDSERPWKEFTFKVPNEAVALFRSMMHSTLGNGRDTLFWEDRWLGGYMIEELANSP